MKMYGKKFIRRIADNAADKKVETRDAVITQIDFNNHLVYVKAQGSPTKTIAVYWPENWEQQPSWMKVGNSVRITHGAGLRGRIEVTGHGMYLPTGIVVPAPVLTDAILCGFQLLVPAVGASLTSNFAAQFISSDVDPYAYAYNKDSRQLVKFDTRGANVVAGLQLSYPGYEFGAMCIDKNDYQHLYVALRGSNNQGNIVFRVDLSAFAIDGSVVSLSTSGIVSMCCTGDYLFFSTSNSTLYKFDLSTSTVVQSLPFYGGAITDYYPGSTHLWTGGGGISGAVNSIAVDDISTFSPTDDQFAPPGDTAPPTLLSQGVSCLIAGPENCLLHDAYHPAWGVFYSVGQINANASATRGILNTGPTAAIWTDYTGELLFHAVDNNLGAHHWLGWASSIDDVYPGRCDIYPTEPVAITYNGFTRTFCALTAAGNCETFIYTPGYGISKAAIIPF
jgi:hypothetical protein